MAIEFDGNLATAFTLQDQSYPASPISMACRFRKTTAASSFILSLTNDGSSNNNLRAQYLSGNDSMRCRINDTSGDAIYQTSANSVILNTWQHLCVVNGSATDHRIYVDGGSKGTITTSKTPTGLDTVCCGGRVYGTGPHIAETWVGQAMDVAVWNVAFTDAQVVELAKPLSYRWFKPKNLLFYSPIVGIAGKNRDFVSGKEFKKNGTLADSTLAPRITMIPGDFLDAASIEEAVAATKNYYLGGNPMNRQTRGFGWVA
jgi:hypothetical protein